MGLPLLLETVALVDHVSPFLSHSHQSLGLKETSAWECWKVVVHTGKFIWSFWQASACPFLSFPSSKGSYCVYLSFCIYHQFCFSSLLGIFSASSFFHSPSPLWLDQSSQDKDGGECPDSCSYNPTESQRPPGPRVMLSLSGFLCQRNQAAHCQIGLCRTFLLGNILTFVGESVIFKNAHFPQRQSRQRSKKVK